MSRKTLAIALFASLALNLFLVGAVAGGLVVGHRVRGGEHSTGMRAPPPVWRAGEVLSEDQAQAYRRALRDQSVEVREAMRAARTARMDTWRSIGKEPFDPARKLHAKVKKAAMARGLMVYPMGGTIDGVRGDHVLLAPPFIVTADQIDGPDRTERGAGRRARSDEGPATDQRAARSATWRRISS